MRAAIVALIVVLSGCGGSSGAASSGPWEITIGDGSYSSDVVVGETILITVPLSNSGTASTPGTTLQFSGINDVADIIGCTPACPSDDLFGFISVYFAGVSPGDTKEFQVGFLATDVGVANWTVQVYDRGQGEMGNVVGTKSGTTIVR